MAWFRLAPAIAVGLLVLVGSGTGYVADMAVVVAIAVISGVIAVGTT
jgi:hypothetical protein